MRLLQNLNRVMEEKPNHEIIIEREKTFTYKDIKNHIAMWKHDLEQGGVFKRARIVVYVKQTIDIVGIYFALCELDCIIIPVDISVTQSTIFEVIKSSKAHFVISLPELDPDSFQKVSTLPSTYILYRTNHTGDNTSSDIMQFLYTSGTTGLPKCVMFSKSNMANNIIELANALALSEDDVIYTPVSLMLPAALNTVLLPALLSGAKVFVSESTVPGSVLRNIAAQGVTVFFAVPFYYKLLTDSKLCTEETWRNVRLCLTSSAYLSKEDFTGFHEKSKRGLHSIYCSSEAGTIAYNGSEHIENLCRYVGKPLTGCEVTLINVNEEGVGEIVVKGGMISSNYFENEELNKIVYQNEGVKTGDLGFLQEDGNIVIKGRVSETINVAGHLVNPLEVEQVIMKLKAVKDVVAYKYLNHANNDMLGVKVVVTEGCSLSESDIIGYCETILPNYKVPKKVQLVNNIEMGRYGKKKRSI